MTFTYSVFDIYGDTNPPIPNGWQKVDFRPPTVLDAFLTPEGFVDEPVGTAPDFLEDVVLYDTPYIILRKKRGPKKAVPAGRTNEPTKKAVPAGRPNKRTKRRIGEAPVGKGKK